MYTLKHTAHIIKSQLLRFNHTKPYPDFGFISVNHAAPILTANSSYMMMSHIQSNCKIIQNCEHTSIEHYMMSHDGTFLGIPK